MNKSITIFKKIKLIHIVNTLKQIYFHKILDRKIKIIILIMDQILHNLINQKKKKINSV